MALARLLVEGLVALPRTRAAALQTLPRAALSGVRWLRAEEQNSEQSDHQGRTDLRTAAWISLSLRHRRTSITKLASNSFAGRNRSPSVAGWMAQPGKG
jgi:hypothetical protein